VKTIKIYTLEELKTLFPEAYAKVHEKWKEACQRSGETPWQGEVMDSLKAVVRACNGRMKDWSIGPYTHCDITIGDIDDEDQDMQWFVDNVLKPNGYWVNGAAVFPGNCAFTGYCADDDFLEQVHKELASGSTMTQALESLADAARQHMEDDAEQQEEEDSMLANWGEREFTKHGKPV
jgi:hypothetical protein